MAVMVRVSATVTGRRRGAVPEHDLALALPAGPVTSGQIICAAVAAEVAGYQARAEKGGFVRVLTERSLLDGLARGAVGVVTQPGPADVAAATSAALQAYEDGIFRVFAGDDEVDGTVELADGARLLFLRLVPLAGG
jgi:hypothetical protein